MANDENPAKESNKMIWSGRIISAVPVIMLIFSASMKFVKPEGFSEGLTHLGWDETTMTYIGVVELLCALVYLVPKTAVLGAILIAAYLGGATATHVRVGDPFFIPIVLGMVAWLGLWLRDKRLRELLPLVN